MATVISPNSETIIHMDGEKNNKICEIGKFISVFTKDTLFVHSLIQITPTIFGPFPYRPIFEVFLFI
jgi:hypothetical protein